MLQMLGLDPETINQILETTKETITKILSKLEEIVSLLTEIRDSLDKKNVDS